MLRKMLHKGMLNRVANETYPGLAIFVRDVNLPEEFAAKYTPGLIIREKAFVDASSRVMGMITSHRYMICSNHMRDLSQFEEGTNWGLCVAQRDSRFKVLGVSEQNGKTAIILLHLPDDETWKVFQQYNFSMDDAILQMATERFIMKCDLPPVPELATEAWMKRCDFPIGMNYEGKLWELE